jgi:hypothetical protein
MITCGRFETLYIGDREACGEVCPNPDCEYTSDITHAKNFHTEGEYYMEDYEE